MVVHSLRHKPYLAMLDPLSGERGDFKASRHLSAASCAPFSAHRGVTMKLEMVYQQLEWTPASKAGTPSAQLVATGVNNADF